MDASLRRLTRVAETQVVVSTLVDADGSVSPITLNKLVLSLVGIEPETLAQRSQLPSATSRMLHGPGPLHLNLLILLSASHDAAHHLDGLNLLSHAMAWLQSHPVMDRREHTELDPQIDRMTLELEYASLADMNALWGAGMGQRRPAALYRMRLLTIDGARVVRQVDGLRAPDVAVGNGHT